MRSAFTIVELLIVLAISALLSGLAITYSSVGRNQVALSIESSEIAQFILQAKALSIATYTGNSASCGYGVSFDIAKQTYSVFSYSPSGAPPCPSASDITSLDPNSEEEYTQGTWHVPITPGVKLQSQNQNMAVLFYPPDPTVFLSDDGTSVQPSTMMISLVTIDGKSGATISINPEGQVSF